MNSASVKKAIAVSLKKLVRALTLVDSILRQRSTEEFAGDDSPITDSNNADSNNADSNNADSSIVDPAVESQTEQGADTTDDSKKLSSVLSLRRVAAIVLAFGPLYGMAMGSYAYVIDRRSFLEQVPQLLYSGFKVPLLIVFTVVISLPSFFVINTLLGLRDDFRQALCAIVSAQAGLVVILVWLFPLTLFSYVSFAPSEVSYQLAVLFNAAMFGLASVAAQVLLRSYYSPLIKRDRRHLWMVRMWIFVYAFVGIQAGYVLRPFIGDPSTPTTFLRKESFQNAYVKIFENVCRVIESMF